jgi:putative cell wall-binding protein
MCADLWQPDAEIDYVYYIDSRCGDKHAFFEFADLPAGNYYVSFSDFDFSYAEWYSSRDGGDYRAPADMPMTLTVVPGGHIDVIRLTAETSPDTPYVYTYPFNVKLTIWPPITETVPSFQYLGRGGAWLTSNNPIEFVNGEGEVTLLPDNARDAQIRFTYTSGAQPGVITSNFFQLDKYRPEFTIAPVAPALPGETVVLSATMEIPYTDLAAVISREPGGPWTISDSMQMVNGVGTYSVIATWYPVEYYFSGRGVDSNIVVVGPEVPTVSRIGGESRYDVAVGISAEYFPGGADVVYVATGTNFPDALSAAPAASLQGAPLLLVDTNVIPQSVRDELTRLGPDKIIIAGGPASVSDAVMAQLQTYAATVVRHSGENRYEVSNKITRDAFTSATVAYIATGATFPDALSASAAAGNVNAPVILVYGLATTLDADTADLLQDLGVTDIRIAGGPASVHPNIETALANLPGVTSVTRLTGADRFVVSGATNRAAFTSADTVFLASGLNFPDALSGAAVAGAVGAPLYVIPPSCVPGYVLEDIANFGATEVRIFGGPASVTPAAAALTRC